MRFGFNEIWRGIDALAKNNGLSVSGLAGKAGLNPTTFNKSKRFGADGRKRWPSTESVNKILEATDTSVMDFLAMASGNEKAVVSITLPLLCISLAERKDVFDDHGYATLSSEWDGIDLTDDIDSNTYILEIDDDRGEPLYRKGDRLVVSPSCDCRSGDRIVVMQKDGSLLLRELKRKTAYQVELKSLLGNGQEVLQTRDIGWIAKIMWVSQ